MSEEYAAGIIDGEGSIGIYHKSKSNSYCVIVQVLMKLPTNVPMWLYMNFGGSYGEYKQSKSAFGNGTLARWSVYGTKAQEFLDIVEPYLIDKKEHAKIALAFPSLNRKKDDADARLQEVAYELLGQLNRKGPKRTTR